MNTKAKQKRRRQGRKWVSEYRGRNIIHAYKRRFKVPVIAAVNDLQALGVQLDVTEVANIRLDRHYYGKQMLNKKSLSRLHEIIKNESNAF